MSEWKKVKIGDVLEQYRNTIYIDDSVEYGQITISSKDGIKYRCSKLGKEIGRKRQFLIDLKTYPHTVIFTRQGLADGSIGIAPMDVDGCIATENMPMFSVNEKIIIIDYLRYFFISPEFKKLVATITPSGSAQKAIHEKELLLLEISIPDLQTQQEIVKKMSLQLQKTEQLSKEIEKQKSYAKLLRQNILQDAIEGKLTADWRKTHPVIKGNPDYDAEALFEKIQKEKCHTDSILLTQNQKKRKNGKSLDFPNPCDNEDLPFEIPEGWKWVRLGEIIQEPPRNGYSPKAVDFETPVKSLKLGAVTYGNFDPNEYKYINEEIPKDAYCWLKNGDILIERSNSIEYVGICAIYTGKDNEFMYPDLLMRFRVVNDISNIFIHKVLISPFSRTFFMSNAKGTQKTMPKINQECVVNAKIPLPPFAEQIEIVRVVEAKLQTMSELEKQIEERENLTKTLMLGIIKESIYTV